MSWQVLNATDRLDKCEFQADEDWDTYPRSIYVCPKCGEKTGFNLRDLDKHSFSEATNLSSEHAQLAQASAEEVADSPHSDWNSFLDFYCQGCGTPVRVYYQSWVGGRHTHGHVVRLVVEGESNGI